MNRTVLLGLIGVLASGACSDEPAAPARSVSGGSGGVASSSSSSGGSAVDAASDAREQAGDAGRDTGTGPSGPICRGTFELSASTSLLPVKSPFSISQDELRIGWVEGSPAAIHVAERSSVGSAFVETDVLQGSFAVERPVLDPRGDDLIAIAADRKSFLLFSRAGSGTPFEASSKTIVAALNVFAAGLGAGQELSDLVWGPGGRTLLFTEKSRGIMLARAVLGADDFEAPTLLSSSAELAPASGKLRRPSGMSPDQLNLFFFDDTTNETRTATRTSEAAPFSTFAKLAAIRDAQVGESCASLYYADASGARVTRVKMP